MSPEAAAALAEPELTSDEVRSILDDMARRYLGMSGADEFLAALDEDRLPDHPLIAQMTLLAGGHGSRAC